MITIGEFKALETKKPLTVIAKALNFAVWTGLKPTTSCKTI
jgi:hypothetical protein